MNLNSEYIWIQFILCAAIILYAGIKISYLGDALGEKLKLGKTWVGVTFLALATSLPEMVTCCSAAKIGAANIAIGNIFGSNLFNLLIIAMVMIISVKKFKKLLPNKNHIISGCMGIILVSIATLSLTFYQIFGTKSFPNYGHFFIGIDSIIILIAYFLGMRFLFRREKELLSIILAKDKKRYKYNSTKSKKYKNLSLLKIYFLFGIFTCFIVASGIRMAQLGDIISQRTVHLLGREITIGQTLVGIILIAIATSLPELVVSLSALRLKAYDMAIGNALGSNMFNILIIPIADLFFIRGPILLSSSFSHVFTALLGIIITTIAMLGVVYRIQARAPRKMAIDGWLIIIIYFVGLYLMLKTNLIIQ